MSTQRNHVTCWAIDTNSTDGHGLIGIGWFIHRELDGQRIWSVPYRAGCRLAFFETRAEARRHLQAFVKPRGGYKVFPKASVRRVRITVVPA